MFEAPSFWISELIRGLPLVPASDWLSGAKHMWFSVKYSADEDNTSADDELGGAKLHETTWGRRRQCQPGRTPSTAAASGAPASSWALGAGRAETARARVGVWRAAAAHRCGLGIQSGYLSCGSLHEGQLTLHCYWNWNWEYCIGLAMQRPGSTCSSQCSVTQDSDHVQLVQFSRRVLRCWTEIRRNMIAWTFYRSLRFARGEFTGYNPAFQLVISVACICMPL